MGTNDELTRDLIMYCRLIIQEALRHGGELTIQPRNVPWAQYNSHWYPIKQWFQGTCQQPTGVGAGINHGSGQCVRPGRGHCAYSGRSTFHHVCITCSQWHQARDCKDISQDSPYKRRLQPQAPFNSRSLAEH